MKFEWTEGLSEAAVKALMKKELKFSSYKLWRKRLEDLRQNILPNASKE